MTPLIQELNDQVTDLKAKAYGDAKYLNDALILKLDLLRLLRRVDEILVDSDAASSNVTPFPKQP
jgi:hypothetical protein